MGVKYELEKSIHIPRKITSFINYDGGNLILETYPNSNIWEGSKKIVIIRKNTKSTEGVYKEIEGLYKEGLFEKFEKLEDRLSYLDNNEIEYITNIESKEKIIEFILSTKSFNIYEAESIFYEIMMPLRMIYCYDSEKDNIVSLYT